MMKNLKGILNSFCVMILLVSCVEINAKESTGSAYNSVEYSTQKVYVCTGPKSKRYHRSAHCRGLKKCSRDVKKVSWEEAKKMGRTPCGYCF